MVPKTTEQTIMLSALREIANSSGPIDLADILKTRFSFLSEQQAFQYAANANEFFVQGEQLTAELNRPDNLNPVLDSLITAGGRFAFVRLSWIDNNGQLQVRDIHIGLSNGERLDSLQDKINEKIADFQSNTQGRDNEGYPTGGVNAAIGFEIVGLL